MANTQLERIAVKHGLIEAGTRLGKLLDPHLHAPTENVAKEEIWPLRKTLLFVVGVSLLLWAAVFAVFRFLLGP